MADDHSGTPVAGNDPNSLGSNKRLEAWKDAIRLGIRYRQIYGRSAEWTEYKNFYRGYFRPGTVPVNIIYAVGRSLVPQLYFRDPRVSIVPLKPGYTMHARVLERLDNLLVQETGLKEEMKSMILDAYLCGTAPGIFGYDSEYGFKSELAADELEGDGSLSSFAKGGEKIEYNYNVSPGMPWFLRCSPTDFIVPWGTKKFKEVPWFAFRKMRPLQDIKEDPKYKNTSKMKGTYRSRLETSDKDGKAMIYEDVKSEWCELWQIHDQRTGFVSVVALDHPQFLRDEFDELQVEGLPAQVVGFNEDPDYFWWTPDCRLIREQQLEINDIRTMARAHRRVALLKLIYDKSIKPEEIAKLMDGDPKTAVSVDIGATGDIRKLVQLFQSHVPPDLLTAAREVREDIREIVGFSRNQMGSFEESSGRRTAHEAEIVRMASMIRIDERRDIMADTFTDIIRKYNQLIFKNWNAEKIVDVVGQDGARYWIRFTGKELRGEFAEKVKPEESMPSSQATKRQDAQTFVDMATKIPGMDMKYLLESYASTFAWIDPQLLFPGEGPGRSPEKAMQFGDFMRMTPRGAQQSSQPGIAI